MIDTKSFAVAEAPVVAPSKMSLSIVFPLMNQHALARVAIGFAIGNLSHETSTVVLALDNGSDTPFSMDTFRHGQENNNLCCVEAYLSKSIGVYPTFWEGLKHVPGDVVAFFHSDFIITEKDWDKRVLAEFEKDPTLGMIGFIGSNEIDGAGGRGLGTTSNFQGDEYADDDGLGNRKVWTGSAASVHGKHDTGFSPAAVVDGCAMIFRRSVLEDIQQRENFPPHHFYDKLLSCEVRERGFKMGVLGVACDHISGQTVAHEEKYELMAKDWCEAHGIEKTHNWDDAVYHESERQWLKEYRDDKKLIPCHV